MKLIKEKNEGSSKEPQQRRAQSTITPQLEINDIDKQVYKFGGAGGKGFDDKSSSGWGKMTVNTPGFMKGAGMQTQMSFSGMGAAPKNQLLELRKAETISLHMPTIFRHQKVLDSLIQ